MESNFSFGVRIDLDSFTGTRERRKGGYYSSQLTELEKRDGQFEHFNAISDRQTDAIMPG
jgi:hypothetical protein